MMRYLRIANESTYYTQSTEHLFDRNKHAYYIGKQP